MGEELGSGEINGAESGSADGGDGGEGGVGDPGAEGEIEMGDVGVAVEDGGEVLGAEGPQGLAVLCFHGVEGLADQREGLLVKGVFVDEIQDREHDFFRQQIEGVAESLCRFLLLHCLDLGKKEDEDDNLCDSLKRI